MAEINSDPDTFVSVDMYAASQGEMTHPPQDQDSENTHRGTPSNFMGNSGLNDQARIHDFEDSLPVPVTSSSSSSRANNISSFMWNIVGTDENAQVTQSECNETVEDTIEVPARNGEPSVDPSDLCGNFDTSIQLLSSQSSQLPPSQNQPVPDYFQYQELASKASAAYSDNEQSNATLLDGKPFARTRVRSQEDMSHNGFLDHLAQDDLISSLHDQSVPEAPAESRRGTSHFSQTSSHTNDDIIIHASEGITSCEIDNPFPDEDMEPASVHITLISKMGSLTSDEKGFLHSLASGDQSSVQYRVMKRFVDTLVFQRSQLVDMKESEVDLADQIVRLETGQNSEVERERSVVIESLLEELADDHRHAQARDLEMERLRHELEEAKSMNREVVNYFSGFDESFTFSEGVTPALEKVTEMLQEFRDEQESIVVSHQQTIDDYAARLTTMEKALQESHNSYAGLAEKNRELESELLDVREGSPTRSSASSRRASLPQHTFESERVEMSRRLREQEFQLDSLRKAKEHIMEKYDKVQDAFLRLNVEQEQIKDRNDALREELKVAEERCRDVGDRSTKDKERLFTIAEDLSKRLSQSSKELDEKDSEIRRIGKDLEDRISSYEGLRTTTKQLELQLKNLSDAAIVKGRGLITTAHESSSESKDTVEAVITILQTELDKARNVLIEHSEEIDCLKATSHDKDEEIVSLHAECRKLQSALNTRRRISSTLRSSLASRPSEDGEHIAFLRRLSATLGCTSEKNGDLIEELTSKIEDMAKARTELEERNGDLRKELSVRESALHIVRSEMQAEISALKAQTAHLENAKHRADEERNVVETKLLHVLNGKDLLRRESTGDITGSSLGHRVSSVGSETGNQSRRDSTFSFTIGDETIQWNDPVIEAAIASLDALIGKKDEFAERSRILREKLESLLSRMAVGEADGEGSRSVILQAKELQEELTGIVGLQQNVIEKVISNVNNVPHVQDGDGTGRQNVQDETLPYIQSPFSRGGLQISEADLLSSVLRDQNETSGTNSGFEGIVSHSGRRSMGEAASFLSEQLTETRALYNDKMKANAELCGLVEELEQEVETLKKSNLELDSAGKDLVATVSGLKDTHHNFVDRLSGIMGCEKSTVSVEAFVRDAVNTISRMASQLTSRDLQLAGLTGRITNLLSQKRILSHLIETYQSKYKLDVLRSTTSEARSPKRRFRIAVYAVISLLKLTNGAQEESEEIPFIDITQQYTLPPVARIAKRRSSTLPLVEAHIAVASIPQLEGLLFQKDAEIQSLQSSLGTLQRSFSGKSDSSSGMGNVVPSAFLYSEDLVERKNELSTRMRAVISEKHDLENQLSREKQSRLSAEAKCVRYSDKVTSLKKKLGKVTSNSESKERTYKLAIKYLKSKADAAVNNDHDADENADPSSRMRWSHEAARSGLVASRSTLEGYIAVAEAEVERTKEGSASRQELVKYISGLQEALHRIEDKSDSRNQRPSVRSGQLSRS